MTYRGLDAEPRQSSLRQKEGRLSATLQRQRRPSFPQILSDMKAAILRPRKDEAAFLHATYIELANERNISPQETQFDNQHLQVLVIPGSNSVKGKKIAELVPQLVRVVPIPEAREAHQVDVIADVHSKAVSAAGLARENEELRKYVESGELISCAVDVVTVLPVEQDEQLSYKRFGKPSSEEELAQRFVAIKDLVQKYHLSFYPYIIESATEMHNPYYPNRDAVSLQRVAVILTPEVIDALATPVGFARYKDLAEQSLNKLHGSSRRDVTDGQGEKNLLDVSGGFVIEGFRGMLDGKGIQTIITDLHALRPRRIAQKTFDEQEYQYAKKIARGHADEPFIAAYIAKFKLPSPSAQAS